MGRKAATSSYCSPGWSGAFRLSPLQPDRLRRVASIGYLLKSDIVIGDRAESGDVAFPQIGTFAASQRCYCFGESTIYKELASELAAGSKAQQGVKEYLRCSRLSRCSSTTHSIRTMVNNVFLINFVFVTSVAIASSIYDPVARKIYV